MFYAYLPFETPLFPLAITPSIVVLAGGASSTTIPWDISWILAITAAGYLRNRWDGDSVDSLFAPQPEGERWPAHRSHLQPRNTWLAQTIERDSSWSRLLLGTPGCTAGKLSMFLRRNSLRATHCLSVSQ